MSTYSIRLWRRAERIFEAALDRPSDEREAFVRRACQGDDRLITAVLELLTIDEASPAWLERPLVSPAGLPAVAEDELSGRELGPYRIIRLIGSGGMSHVYLAEPSDATTDHEHVAIKLLRKGLRDTETLRRFRRERAILAKLDHPNIARLYHGGTTDDGTPYVVMEYVDGAVLTAYCDERRLTIRGRVQLFIKVALAVQFAHQNLVIHRDLKPGNILVTETGEPKLLDFGISKLLAPLASFPGDAETLSEDRLLTPHYASPEQFSGRALTTASDVYSLGRVLYELLVGQRPFLWRQESLGEIEKILATTEPPAPSVAVSKATEERDGSAIREAAERRQATPTQLERQLSGDLDNILLRSLRRDPSERYTSASQLADDLERYLEGRPVHARPPTVRYRLSKFVQRNWAAVASAAVAILVLMGLVGGLFRQTRQLEEEQETSDLERRRAEEVTRFLVDSFGSAAPRDGREVTARQVLDGAIDQLEELEREPELQARLLDTMGGVYEALELYEVAIRLYEVSLETRVEILGEEHLDVATSHANLGRALAGLGETERAKPQLRRALELRRRGLSSAHPATATSLRDLGRVLTDLGELDEAESVLEESLRLHRMLFGEEHDDTAAACLDLAGALERQGDLEDAEELLLTAFSTLRRLGGDQDPATLRARDRIIQLYETSGRHEEAARYRDGR